MNKTFLKRSLASATGAVLALGQMAATLGIAHAAVDVTVNKEWAATVPVVAANLPSPDSLPASAGFSDWNDRVDTWMTSIEDGEQTTIIEKDNFVGLVRNALANKLAFLDDVSMDAFVDALHDAEVTTSYDGKIHAVLQLDNVGPVVAERMTGNTALGFELIQNIDWSGIQISGAIDITLTFDFEAKKVKTDIAFIDENGKSYSLDSTSGAAYEYTDMKYQEIRAYVVDSYRKEMENIIANEDVSITTDDGETYTFDDIVDGEVVITDENGKTYVLSKQEDGTFVLRDETGATLTLEVEAPEDVDTFDQAIESADAWQQYLDTADKTYAAAIDFVKKANAAVQETTYSGTDFEQAYAAYRAKAVEKATTAVENAADQAMGTSAKLDAFITKYEEKALKTVNVLPETFKGFITFEEYGISFDTFAEYFNSFPGINWQITAADIAGMVDAAYDVTVNFNGYSFDTTFSFGDSQKDELIAAYAEQYADYFAEQNVQVVDVISHKVATIVRDDAASTIFVDIERIIDDVITEPIETTTTTTETTETTTETTETTTETTDSDSGTETTTTTETTDSDSGTETTTTTETTGSGSGTETTTTETTGSGSGTETTTTETTDSGSGTETTETTPAVSFNFGIQQVEGSIGYYWTDEEEEFQCFKSFAASMAIFGDDGSAQNVDVDSSCFAPNVKSAAALGAEGYTKEKVQLLITAEGAETINALIAAAGVDETVAAGDVVASYDITLVQRGNSDMDSLLINPDDATCALRFYTRHNVIGDSYTSDDVKETVAKGAAVDYAGVFYAIDVNADGQVTTEDAVNILRYYTLRSVVGYEVSFDDLEAEAGNSPSAHASVLHIDPFDVLKAQEAARPAE